MHLPTVKATFKIIAVQPGLNPYYGGVESMHHFPVRI